MTTVVTFDTLKLARRLESAGFTRAQADGTAEALADSLSNEIATKGDIAELRADVKTDIAALRATMESRFAGIDTRFASMEGKLGAMEGKFGAMEGKFGAMEGKFGAMEGRFGAIDSKFGAIEGKLGAMESKFAGWIITAVLLNATSIIGAIAIVWQLARK